MDVVTLGAALSIMKKMPDTAASSAAAAEDAADRAEEAARTLTIDDTLTQEGQAADAKAVGDTLAEKLDIADLPDTVSNANQLLSEKYVIDTEPYQYRPSGGQGADRAFDTIVGGSIVWNQLVDDTDSSVTVTGGHKYIAKVDGAYSVAVSDGTAVAVTGGTDEVFDVTQMFGSTIADYIYSLEQATAGAGVAWFKKYFPKDYYEYNAGELIHVTNLQSHDTVGFNLFDKSTITDNSYVNPSGMRSDQNEFFVSDFIPCIPNTVYYSNADVNNRIFTHYFYSADKQYIDRISESKTTFTTPSGAYYMRVNSIKAKITADELCVNLSDPARNGEYEPYVKHSYPLDSTLTLRGIPKLDADNKLYYDGDVYESDGTVTRRYGIVDLGTLDWVYRDSGYNVKPFLANLSDTVVPTASTIVIPAFCLKYSQVVPNKLNVSGADKIFGIGTYFSGQHNINIVDTDYTDATAFKNAMSGVYLIYPLATPTIEQAQPYQSPQIIDPYGTEEYVTTSIVPVGHETKYPENLRAKIEGLPWDFSALIAPTEATYKATRNYTTGSLFIVGNTLYKATANIANEGTITPGTNCTATTLAEIIAALS